MRSPLSNQILVRTLLLIIITISALTFANIRAKIVNNRNGELRRLQNLGELATTSRFPLTSSVLENMKLLSGAEFVLVNENGAIKSKTSGAPTEIPDSAASSRFRPDTTEPAAIEVDGSQYYHTWVKSHPGSRQGSTSGWLHIYVPRMPESAIWWEASKSPLTIALLILPLAVLISFAMASQVTRPLALFQDQVSKIAQGDFQQVPVIESNNEIQDLSRSINEMAIQLQDHESQLRKNERLRTLVQIGSSIAHQLSNSATGCKMATELMASEHAGLANSDNYRVAIRQLGLMDNYVKRFLMLSRVPEPSKSEPDPWIDLNPILENVIYLLRPSAEHLNVELDVDSVSRPVEVRMQVEDAEQLMINLISNAVTAASQRSADPATRERGRIEIQLSANDDRIQFMVTDNGKGPPADIVGSLFQPFVTGSKEGTGLGLSLVEEISKRVGGHVNWKRDDQLTVFTFEFPHQSQLANDR